MCNPGRPTTLKKQTTLKNRKKIIKRLLWTLTIIFVLMNVVAVFHSYKFTHFVDSKTAKTKDPKKLTTGQKISTLIFGVNNPRPENTTVPTHDYEIVKLKSNREIECWNIKTENSKGTVILFHGFSGQKELKIYKNAGHENYLNKYKDEWTKDITLFITTE